MSRTPGPWTFSKECEVWDSADQWVADCGSSLANAQLVAAAPDMLESLRELLLLCELHLDFQPQSLEKARKAIAKAVGT